MASNAASPTSPLATHQRRASSEPNLREQHALATASIDLTLPAQTPPPPPALSTSVVVGPDIHPLTPVPSEPTPPAPLQDPPHPAPTANPPRPAGPAPALQQQIIVADRGFGYWWQRLKRFFGYGRGNEVRKELVTFIFTVCWSVGQLAALTTALVLAGSSKYPPRYNEWSSDYCDRPIGAWSIVWMVRVLVGFFPAYIRYRHHTHTAAFNAAAVADLEAVMAPDLTADANPGAQPGAAPAGAPAAAATPASPPYAMIGGANRLRNLLSFLSIVHFIVSHVLLYTTLNSCHRYAPHLWWALFGVVCIGYLVICEVFVVGAVVFIVIPVLFLFINIVLVCLGRQPLRMGNTINHEIPKLSQRVVDQIPLVLYIPPPPEGFQDTAQPPHQYPPKRSWTKESGKPTRGMFRFLKRKRSPGKGGSSGGKGTSRSGNTWEDKWEKGDWPFVRLEENRATCAICLMDFEPPKKIAPSIIEVQPVRPAEGSAQADPELATVHDDTATGEPDNLFRLEDAGEGVQPLRLLGCGHVFHKTCIDPWLLNSSGRCPHCQRPILAEHQTREQRAQ